MLQYAGLCIAMGLLACTGPVARDHQVTRLGVVSRFPDERWCLAVADSSLRVGKRIAVATIPIVGASSEVQHGLMEIAEVHPGACVGLWGAYGDADYIVTPVEGSFAEYSGGPAVALVGGTTAFIVEDTLLQVDLDADGQSETFRSCTSQEGLHLTLWDGDPLSSARIWHVYFYLGYDVEPSCVEADYAPA